MDPATPAGLGAKGSQARPLSGTICLRAVVRLYRAGLVAECEMCSHGFICLITDPSWSIILSKTLSTTQATIFMRCLTILQSFCFMCKEKFGRLGSW